MTTYKTRVRPIWCAGCGNFGVLDALTRRALSNLGIPNHRILIVSGIGCASRIPGYIDTYGINSIHGRALPFAQGGELSRPALTVIAIGGGGGFFFGWGGPP